MNKISFFLNKKKFSGNQSMLYALSLTEKEIKHKPKIGIGSMYHDASPCHSKLNYLTDKVCLSVSQKKFVPFQFNTVSVTDGLAMNTEAMKLSLPSRDLIADSIEVISKAHFYDGLIIIPACDKTLPATAMALFRLNRPSFIIYGGSMRPNRGKDLVTAFESYGEFLRNKITNQEREFVVKNACHKMCGSCPGFYTANTMAIMLEILGLTIPNSSSNVSLSNEKIQECNFSGDIIQNLIKNNIKPKDYITKKHFINAINTLYIIGGSTNAVMHLLAMAKEANIKLTLKDFSELEETPVLMNVKPHGKYFMYDLYMDGGTRNLIKFLLKNNYIDGNVKTLNQNTFYDEYIFGACVSTKNLDEKFIKQMKNDSHIKILKGNIAQNGCVTKLYSNISSLKKRKVKVFDSENEFLEFLETKPELTSKNCILIRYLGISVGCPEILNCTSALKGYWGDKPNIPCILSDGRLSGGSSGILISQLDDAYNENSILYKIVDDDVINIDFSNNLIEVVFCSKKKRFLKRKKLPKMSGYLEKYSYLNRNKVLETGFI